VESLLDDPDPWIRECARFVARREDAPVDVPGRLALMDRMVFLRQVPLFAELPPQDLKHVADVMTEGTFEDGEAIVREGEAGDELHILVEGEIVVMTGTPSVPVARRGPGDHVGEMAVMTGEPRMATLVCRGRVRTLSLDRSRFERILRDRPGVAIATIRGLSERLRQAHAGQDSGGSAS
jgi:CRP-like cAMP-binding protein